MKTSVSLITCDSYESPRVYESIKEAINLLGGISSFVKPKETILIKPNLLSAKEPERAVTTHPEIVRAVVRLIREAGATPLIGDSPGGAIKGVERVWEKTGMKKLAQEEGVRLVSFETAGSVEKKIDHPLVPTVHISKAVLACDGIINLPKLKTHNLMIFTGCVKNCYGIVPGLRKAEYHKLAPHPDDFGRLLGEIYLLVKDRVRLNIVDGIMGMEGNGPSSGELRKMDLVVAGSDGVAVDAAITNLLGFKPKRIEPFEYLKRKKAGIDDISNIELVGGAKARRVRNFKFPSNWYVRLIPKFVVDILGRFIWMKPVVIEDYCTGCMMCVDSCPVKTIIKERGKKPRVDWKGCISCLCCHELCPSHAIELKSSRLAKMLIRQ